MTASRLIAGASGYSYKEWLGTFYPEKTKPDAMLAFYDGRTAKWSAPADVVFVDELPHTATGKLSKVTLRERFRDYRLRER